MHEPYAYACMQALVSAASRESRSRGHSTREMVRNVIDSEASQDSRRGAHSHSSAESARDVHGKVAAAVKEMQGALQAELHEDHLQLFGLLGQGGFGTVYHGVML